MTPGNIASLKLNYVWTNVFEQLFSRKKHCVKSVQIRENADQK